MKTQAMGVWPRTLALLMLAGVMLVSSSCDKKKYGPGAEAEAAAARGPIRSGEDAAKVATAFTDIFNHILDNNPSTSAPVDGVLNSTNGGTASLSGQRMKTKVSSTTDEYMSKITATFNNYEYRGIIVTGKVTFYEDRYVSLRKYTDIRKINGTGVKIEISTGDYTIDDTIVLELVSSKGNLRNLGGKVISGGGSTYYPTYN